MNNNNIEEGDYVKHVEPLINGGLKMCVEEINEENNEAKCSHFVKIEDTTKVDWFPLTDLILVQKADGGFIA